ncbi:hypothetical protein ANO11243_007630 [Dothideomycetidae sp. 11243]|nr:hypothetical protein ANO11243_007630 [fungal sp. No.11243]
MAATVLLNDNRPLHVQQKPIRLELATPRHPDTFGQPGMQMGAPPPFEPMMRGPAQMPGVPQHDPTGQVSSNAGEPMQGLIIKNAAGEEISRGTLGDARLIAPHSSEHSASQTGASSVDDGQNNAAPAIKADPKPSKASKKKAGKKKGTEIGSTAHHEKAIVPSKEKGEQLSNNTAVAAEPDEKQSSDIGTTAKAILPAPIDEETSRSSFEETIRAKIILTQGDEQTDREEIDLTEASALSPKLSAAKSLTLPKRTRLEKLPEEPEDPSEPPVSVDAQVTGQVEVRLPQVRGAGPSSTDSSSSPARSASQSALPTKTVVSVGKSSPRSISFDRGQNLRALMASVKAQDRLTPVRYFTGQNYSDSVGGADDIDDSFQTAAESPDMESDAVAFEPIFEPKGDRDVGKDQVGTTKEVQTPVSLTTQAQQQIKTVPGPLADIGNESLRDEIDVVKGVPEAQEQFPKSNELAAKATLSSLRPKTDEITPSINVQIAEADENVSLAHDELVETTAGDVPKPAVTKPKKNPVSLKVGPKQTESLSPYARQVQTKKADKKAKQGLKAKTKSGADPHKTDAKLDVTQQEAEAQHGSSNMHSVHDQSVQQIHIDSDKKSEEAQLQIHDAASKQRGSKTKMNKLKEIPSRLKGALKASAAVSKQSVEDRPPIDHTGSTEGRKVITPSLKDFTREEIAASAQESPRNKGKQVEKLQTYDSPQLGAGPTLSDKLSKTGAKRGLDAALHAVGFDGTESEKDQTAFQQKKERSPLRVITANEDEWVADSRTLTPDSEGPTVPSPRLDPRKLPTGQPHLLEGPKLSPNAKKKRNQKKKRDNRKSAAKAAREKAVGDPEKVSENFMSRTRDNTTIVYFVTPDSSPQRHRADFRQSIPTTHLERIVSNENVTHLGREDDDDAGYLLLRNPTLANDEEEEEKEGERLEPKEWSRDNFVALLKKINESD